MHQDSAGATETPEAGPGSLRACEACSAEFQAKRDWQRFCSAPCRKAYHAKLTPEALRRDLDAALRRIEALERG
jgi:protein-arginine kinase activator protein McsA